MISLRLLAQYVVGPKILSDLNRLSKNVKVICICEMLNDLGASIHRPLLPVLYRMLGATPLQYGIVEGLSSFFGMIGAAPAGSLSDRIGRKKIYCAGHALMGLLRPTWSLVSSFSFIGDAGTSVSARSYGATLFTVTDPVYSLTPPSLSGDT
jgi:MFS family permease